jgi:hypothetical protein
MIVNLHIERLVLDGSPLQSGDGPRVAAAVERELARLLGSGAMVRGRSVAAASVAAAPVMVHPGMRPQAFGRSIAESVYGGLTHTCEGRSK